MRRWIIGLGLVVALVAAGAVLFVMSARGVAAQLTAAKDDLVATRGALSARDAAAAQESIAGASEHAQQAVDGSSGPLWRFATALPILGATPTTVQVIAASADEAVDALLPAVEALAGLQPAQIVGKGGRIDDEAVSAALPPLQAAKTGVQSASHTLAGAPSAAEGDLVVEQVDDARWQLADQLETLDDTLGAVIDVAEIVPPLLGSDETKRYFMAITNPNEARGTGGFLGTYAIVRAKSGKLTVEEVGSNSDLPSFTELPLDFGDDYAQRYGDDPALVANMNISPHFPYAARLWLESWEAKTGEKLDGALSADVVALGRLVTASGEEVPLPDGGSLTGAELTEFALTGIYEKFPEAGETPERKAYQEQVAAAAVDIVADADDAEAKATAIADSIAERRILAWVRDKKLQRKIIDTSLGGSLAVPSGPNLTFVAINSSGSKLDAYLERSVRYAVGRCPDPRNRVRSQLEVTVTNDVPKGEELPPYVISQAEVGKKGPINSTLAQVHLPHDAVVTSVAIDREPVLFAPFVEQDRPSLVLEMELPPRKARTLVVDFLEPFSGKAASVAEQPLATPQETTIVERPC